MLCSRLPSNYKRPLFIMKHLPLIIYDMPVNSVITEKLCPCSTHLMDKNWVILKPKPDYISCSGSTWETLINRTLSSPDILSDCFWAKQWHTLSDILLNKCILLMGTNILHWCNTAICKALWPVSIYSNEERFPYHSFHFKIHCGALDNEWRHKNKVGGFPSKCSTNSNQM